MTLHSIQNCPNSIQNDSVGRHDILFHTCKNLLLHTSGSAVRVRGPGPGGAGARGPDPPPSLGGLADCPGNATGCCLAPGCATGCKPGCATCRPGQFPSLACVGLFKWKGLAFKKVLYLFADPRLRSICSLCSPLPQTVGPAQALLDITFKIRTRCGRRKFFIERLMLESLAMFDTHWFREIRQGKNEQRELLVSVRVAVRVRVPQRLPHR